MDLVESELSKGEDIGRHPWELARKSVVASLIRKYIPGFRKGKRTVLDIGCGDTWLIEQLYEIFPQSEMIAVDTAFNEQLLAFYRKKLEGKPFKIHDNLEEALSGKKEKVDLILLLDVIEHIEDDIGFLKWVLTFSDQIDSDTRFLITVPAFQKLFCSHDVFLGHYRRYNNKLLKTNIEKAGLEVERIGYFFTSLLLPRYISAMVERSSGKKKEAKGVAAWKEGLLDGLVKKFLILDYRVSSLLMSAGIKLPGLSNYVICKRRA